MTLYIRNRACRCARCRAKGLMGGAILVTLGILFLLEENRIARFDDTWPVLLIVIGLLVFASRTASTEGHVQAKWVPRSYAPPPPEPPPPPANPPSGENDPQVHP